MWREKWSRAIVNKFHHLYLKYVLMDEGLAESFDCVQAFIQTEGAQIVKYSLCSAGGKEKLREDISSVVRYSKTPDARMDSFQAIEIITAPASHGRYQQDKVHYIFMQT